jgi:membrane associated rhomboid family serine protease
MLSNLAPRELIDQLNRRGQPGRNCPRCHRAMTLVHIRFNQKELDLEVCQRKCRLAWFDSGEILRALRHRSPENTVADADEEETGEVPRPIADAYRPFRVGSSRAAVIAFPWRTFQLVLACALLFPIARHLPDTIGQFGLLPADPLRFHGLTWLSSLFLYDRAGALLGGMLLLGLAGRAVEKAIGGDRFFALFLVSGLIGRLIFFLSSSSRDPVAAGAGDAICGVCAYALLIFPYREFFFPDQRWKSRTGVMVGIGVTAVTVFGFLLGWDFFQVALHHAAEGAHGVIYDESFFVTLRTWLDSPVFQGRVAAAAVGLLWSVADLVVAPGRPEPAVREPREGASPRIKRSTPMRIR